MITKGQIYQAFNAYGLTVDKIRRSRLNDGWYVYHPNGWEQGAVTYAVVARTENTVTKSRTVKKIYSNFIDDTSEESLFIALNESLVFAGKPKVGWEKFKNLLAQKEQNK